MELYIGIQRPRNCSAAVGSRNMLRHAHDTVAFACFGHCTTHDKKPHEVKTANHAMSRKDFGSDALIQRSFNLA